MFAIIAALGTFDSEPLGTSQEHLWAEAMQHTDAAFVKFVAPCALASAIPIISFRSCPSLHC